MRKRKIRREIARRLKALLSRMESLPKEFRLYQVEALQSVIRWLEDPKGTARAYIEHATGLGKTELFAAIVSACVGLRALIVVPTKMLIEQTARRVVTYTGGMLGHLSSLGPIKDDAGVIIAVRGHEFCDILITTDESLKLHGRFLAEKFAPHLVIRDECHGSYSESEQAIMDHFSDAVILGFTATPDYLGTIVKETYAPVTLDNGRILYAPPGRTAREHYGTCLDQRTVRWGIEEGYLAPLAWGHIEFDVSLDEVGIAEGGETGPDYSDVQLQALLRKHWQFMVDTVVQLYKRGEYDLPNRQVFAVCTSVREAQQIANALKEAGYPAACITGKTRDKERQSILEKFKTGEIKFLSSVMVLREGWDAPNAEVCLMLRPTRSRVLYMQSMGRVLRTMADGSFKCALVIDAYFLNTRFAPLSAPILFGLPGQTVEDGGILVGPKDGYVAIPTKSPYQRPGIKPRLAVVPAEYDMEYWANEQGFFSADGFTWGVINAVSEKVGVSTDTIVRKARNSLIRTRESKGYNGHSGVTFYCLEDAVVVCKDLTTDLPQADSSGTFKLKGKVYGSVPVIAKMLGLKEETVRSRVNKAPALQSIKGKDVSGQLVDFYLAEEVSTRCADLLKKLRKAGRDGTFDVGGKTYATVKVLKRLLGLNPLTIRRRIAQANISPMEGRIGPGRVEDFYPVEEVRAACSDLLSTETPRTKRGTVSHDGLTYGTVEAIREAADGISREAADNLVREPGVRSIEGKDDQGRGRQLYCIEDALKALSGSSKDKPRKRRKQERRS